MKNKILIFILAIVLILGGMYLIDKNRMKNNKSVIFGTWGHSYTPPKTESGKDKLGYYFYATVVEVYEKSVIVEPVEGSRELNSSDKISIRIENTKEYPIGTKLKITYDGIIMETYPAQINEIKVEIVQ